MNSDQFNWCANITAAVARGVRFCDAAAKDQCIRDATLHLFKTIEKFDPSRGVPMQAYAGFIVRRRLIRLAQIELRARLHCYVRPEKPYKPHEAEPVKPVCCAKCRPVVAAVLNKQISACRRSDADCAEWTRDVIIGQKRLLVGEPDTTRVRRSDAT